MRKRPTRPARALRSAAALLAIGLLAATRPAFADDPRALEVTSPSDVPAESSTTVDLLAAQAAGDVAVEIRGTGEANHVRVALRNDSNRILNVVIPPGLVAAAGTSQGLQSMGLGVPTANLGRFGRAASVSSGTAAFRSLPADSQADGIALEPGELKRFDLPSVCLNFGLPTPKSSNVFTLKTVDEYTTDARARKALKSLAVLGTSQGVAQAVAWHVFNGMTASEMAKHARQYLNDMEISAAARFVEVLDASGTEGLVDAESLRKNRLLARVRGEEGPAQATAIRLNSELNNAPMLGLPVSVIEEVGAAESKPATLLIDLTLTAEADGQVRARASLRRHSILTGWTRMGAVDLGLFTPRDLSGETLVEVLDRTIARELVSASPASRGAGLRVSNRLPLTLDGVVFRGGESDEAPEWVVRDLGVGPRRSGLAPVPASGPIVVEKVELSGL